MKATTTYVIGCFMNFLLLGLSAERPGSADGSRSEPVGCNLLLDAFLGGRTCLNCASLRRLFDALSNQRD